MKRGRSHDRGKAGRNYEAEAVVEPAIEQAVEPVVEAVVDERLVYKPRRLLHLRTRAAIPGWCRGNKLSALSEEDRAALVSQYSARLEMSEFPRRNRLDLQTPTERAIRAAIRAVEEAGCDEALTDAVVLLGKALERVSDFVDTNGGRPIWHLANDPPFDGKLCPACPSQIRGLIATANNYVLQHMGRSGGKRTTLRDLEMAVEAAQPIMDAHFADRKHSHGI